MDNKPNSDPVRRVQKSSRLLIFALIVAGLAAFGLSRFSAEDEPSKPLLAANHTEAAWEDEDAAQIQPLTLDPARVAAAEPVETGIQGMNLAEISGRSYRTVLLTPKADWQGDFTAERIARTLINAAKAHLDAVDVVNVYLLPCEIKSEMMFDTTALGKLSMDAGEPAKNNLSVQTRGYLPQEIQFIALADQRWPEFLLEQEGEHLAKFESLDREALTKAIIEEIGPDAYGISYPFQIAKEVANLPAVLAACGMK